MPYITLASGLTIKVPTKGTTDWSDTMKSDTFQKVSEHDHTGSGRGTIIGTASIAADAVNDLKIRLINDSYLRSRNAANLADINIVKVDANDEIVINHTKSFSEFNFTDGASNEDITDLILDPTSNYNRGAIIQYSVFRDGTTDLNEVGVLHVYYDGSAWQFSRDFTGDDALVTFDFSGNQLRISNTANPGSASENLYYQILKLGA